MSDYLIQRHDLCMTDPAPFNQHWEARIAVPVSSIDIGKALQPCGSALRAGDLVNITSFTRRDWLVMTEVASFRVASNASKVVVVQVGNTVAVPEHDVNRAENETVRLAIVQVGAAYIVQDEKGNDLETFVDMAQAETFKQREERRVRPVVPSASEPASVAASGRGRRRAA